MTEAQNANVPPYQPTTNTDDIIQRLKEGSLTETDTKELESCQSRGKFLGLIPGFYTGVLVMRRMATTRPYFGTFLGVGAACLVNALIVGVIDLFCFTDWQEKVRRGDIRLSDRNTQNIFTYPTQQIIPSLVPPQQQPQSYPFPQTLPTTQTSAYPNTQTSIYPTPQISALPTPQTNAYPITTQTSAYPTTQTAYPTTQTSVYPTTQTSAPPTTQTSAHPTPQTNAYPNTQTSIYPTPQISILPTQTSAYPITTQTSAHPSYPHTSPVMYPSAYPYAYPGQMYPHSNTYPFSQYRQPGYPYQPQLVYTYQNPQAYPNQQYQYSQPQFQPRTPNTSLWPREAPAFPSLYKQQPPSTTTPAFTPTYVPNHMFTPTTTPSTPSTPSTTSTTEISDHQNGHNSTVPTNLTSTTQSQSDQ